MVTNFLNGVSGCDLFTRVGGVGLVLSSLMLLSQLEASRGNALTREVFAEEYDESGGARELKFDSAGVGYLATQTGLVRIEGTEWKEHSFDGDQKVYSLDVDESGNVYLGLFGDFGYIDFDGNGEYVSLVKGSGFEGSLSRLFSEIIVLDNGVYARTGESEFYWDRDLQALLKLPDLELDGNVFEFEGRAYRFGSDFWLNVLRDGVWSRVGSVALPEGASPVVSSYSSAENGTSCLVVDGRWVYSFDGSSFSLFAEFENSKNVSSIVSTKTGNVLVGIVGEGIKVFDNEANLIQELSSDRGLLDASLIDLEEDLDGKVWVLQERGLTIAQVGEATAHYGPSEGLEGIVYAVAEFENNLYAATSLGLFRMDLSVLSLGNTFVQVDGVGGCKSLVLVDDRLIVGSFAGLYEVFEGRLSNLVPDRDSSFVKLLSVDAQGGRVLIGNSGGLALYIQNGDTWSRFGGWSYEYPVYGLTLDPHGDVWIDSGKGVTRRLKLSDGLAEIETFTTADGLTSNWTTALEFGGRMAFTTKSPRLLGFNEGNGRFEIQDDLEYFPPPGPFVFRQSVSDGDSKLWTMHSLVTGNLSPKPVGDFGDGILHVGGGRKARVNGYLELSDGSYVFAMKEGVVRYDDKFSGLSDRVLKTWISSVYSVNEDRFFSGVSEGGVAPVLEFGKGSASIRVLAAVNQWQMSDDYRFDFSLRGPKSENSGSTKERSWEFRDLPDGEYQLSVLTTSTRGRVAEPVVLHFRVLPLFYQTRLAYGLYVLIALALVLSIVRIRVLSLRKTNERLAGLVEERTHELADKNEKLARVNEELVQMAEDAKQAAAAKSSFLAVMSHEIRTPLNGVLGMCSLLKRTDLNVVQRDYLNSIKVSGQTLLDVVNDVLDYSKIEKGRLDLECIPFDIVELVESVGTLLGPRLNEKKLDLFLKIDQRIKRIRYGDPTRVRQILYNLLGNAIKFTERGSVSVFLYPKYGDNMHELALEVIDTGVGIEAEKLDVIFDAFSQSDVSDVRRFGGTGLGLSICRQLTSLMGGNIAVDSQVGVGSTFKVNFTLPELNGGEPLWSSPILEGRSVTLCCSDVVMRRFLGDYMSRWGLRIRFVDSSSLARNWAVFEERSDCFVIETKALSDERLNALLSCAKESATPVVLLDSYQPRIFNDENSGNEFDSMILPIVPSRLLGVLSLACGRREADDESEETKGESQSRFDGLSVLLAEDNQMNQEVAQRLLLALGVEVTVVANGCLAVEEYERRDYDLVLMDVQMPEMGGIEATRHIMAAHRQGPKPFIYCLTAGDLEVESDRCREAGMVGFIGKPFAVEDLVEALNSAELNRSAHTS